MGTSVREVHISIRQATLDQASHAFPQYFSSKLKWPKSTLEYDANERAFQRYFSGEWKY